MPASESVKAAAFEAGADPALVIGSDGLLRAANEAAETLFGQGLGVLSRGRLRDALAPSDGIIQLIERAVETGAHARGRDLEVALLGQTAFHADAVAAPLEVRIQDNGPGVAPGLRDQLFEPFVSSKANGTGLGLALVAKLVGAHGGLVDFESEPGRTVFRVLLPVHSDGVAG